MTYLRNSISFILVFWAAWQASSFFEVFPHTSAFYIPPSLSVIFIALFGWRYVPVVFIATFFSSFPNPSIWDFIEFDILQNLRQTLIYGAAGVLFGIIWDKHSHKFTLNSSISFITLMFVASFGSALIAHKLFSIYEVAPAEHLSSIFFSFWWGDFAGVVLVTPLILTIVNSVKREDFNFSKSIETFFDQRRSIILFLCIAFPVTITQFSIQPDIGTNFNFLVIIPILSMALLYGVASGIIATFITCGMLILFHSSFVFNVNQALELQALLGLCGSAALLSGSIFDDLCSQVTRTNREVNFNRKLLETTNQGYWYIDLEGKTLNVNPAMCHILMRSRNDLIGKSIYEFVNSQNSNIFDVEIKSRRDGRKSEYEIELQRPDGSIRTCINNASPIIDDNGNEIGSFGLWTDITERKQKEIEALLAKEEAESANSAKTDFLASMSHELRTPLNAILGFAQFLKFDATNHLSNNQNEHLDHIIDSGNHLLELVNEILDLSLIESGQLALKLEDVSAKEIIDDCVALASALSGDKNITIVDKCENGFSSILHTDKKRVTQIIINLLSNAIKFNKENGKIEINCKEIEEGSLRISIRDTGIGISEENYENIFQLFHRIGMDPHHTQDGTGIGLAVSKMLAERMAGHLGFISVKDEGSIFWLDIPLASNENVMIWTEAMRTGVQFIDDDHLKLASILNRISHKPKEYKEDEKHIERFIKQVKGHFEKEELIMEVCDYPDLEPHRNLHEELLSEVNRHLTEFSKNKNIDEFPKLRKFLRDWLISHIMGKDMLISHSFQGKERIVEKALQAIE